MSKLKAKTPEQITNKRLKMFFFGDSGVGKTTAAIQFPKPYFIDAERGAENESYVRLLKESGGVYLGTTDIEEVIEEVRLLRCEKHDYRTLVIDPMTNLESDLNEKSEREFGAGDMRIWNKRDRVLKRLVNMLYALDMNVIVVAHSKVDYGPNMTKLGTTYDGWKRWIYVFDLAIELIRHGGKRVALVRKSRLEQFKDGETFPFSFEVFAERMPTGFLSRESVPAPVASEESVKRLRSLIETVNLPDGTVAKWLSKAGVDDLDDMAEDAVQACILYVTKKIAEVNPNGKDK